MDSEEDEQLSDWLTRCDAIVGSDSYLQIGHPEDQVIVLKGTLLQAAAASVSKLQRKGIVLLTVEQALGGVHTGMAAYARLASAKRIDNFKSSMTPETCRSASLI